MALVKCRECGHDISSRAKECPNCGIKIKNYKRGIIIATTFIFIAFLIILIFSQHLKTVERTNHIAKPQHFKEVFNKNIENNYQKLLSSFNSNNYEETSKIIGYFKLANRLDYKDVQPIYKKVTIDKLKKELKLIPSSNCEERLKIIRQILELEPNDKASQLAVSFYEGVLGQTHNNLE